MHRHIRAIGVGCFGLVLCMALTPLVFSADKAVYDKPNVEEPGTTIFGKVVQVVERDAAAHKWDVSVENKATGEVVLVHLDKTTAKKEKTPDPAIGDQVVVKYNEQSKHALTFVWDSSPNPQTP